MPKYSIIIPVYKAEKTISECVDSILRQAFEDFELILVNDCSPDKSSLIVAKYASKDNRIKILNQPKNLGVSAARNRGLNVAKGDYILFVDSDDFVSDDYLSIIDKELTEKPTDLLSFGMNMYYQYPGEPIKTEISSMNCEVDGEFPSCENWHFLCLKSFFASPCNKVFLRSIIEINTLRFDETCVSYEDFIFNCKYCNCIRNFRIISRPLYFYRQLSKASSASKRNWEIPFSISRKVVDICKEFIEIHKDFNLSNIMLHALQSYRIELQYAFLQGEKKFYSAVKEVCNDEKFIDTIDLIKPKGKTLLLLKLGILLHLSVVQRAMILRIIR